MAAVGAGGRGGGVSLEGRLRRLKAAGAPPRLSGPMQLAQAGVRGSRRYVERHLDELKSLDARVLNFETIAHPEVDILTSDLYGSVKNSPEMVKSLVAAAGRAGVPYRVRSASAGVGTDAGRFSQAGLKAASLLGFRVPGQMVAFYHQRRDTSEVLSMEPLLNVLKLTLEWIASGGEASE